MGCCLAHPINGTESSSEGILSFGTMGSVVYLRGVGSVGRTITMMKLAKHEDTWVAGSTFSNTALQIWMTVAVQYDTNESGQRTSVIISIHDYERLVEDFEDFSVMADRREEPTVPHDQFLQELK